MQLRFQSNYLGLSQSALFFVSVISKTKILLQKIIQKCQCFFYILGVKTLYHVKRKLWSSSRALGSRSEGRGFNPLPMLDGSGVKATPESIPTPNSGSLQKNKKIQVAKWGTPKKY